ncbi:peptide chain release factor N(5)-glutamine methyltransferase [Chloroflexota bacterium]
MNLKQALAEARTLFRDNDIEDTSLESEILLRHTLQVNRAQLYLDFNRELSPIHETVFRHLVERRLRGEPSAYITGHREFYGLDFYVDHRVLIPRPETELLLERAINLAQHRRITTIAEIGTGCGAIAVGLAKNLPQAVIYATDISAPALEVARFNCRQHGVENNIRLLPGDMLDPLPEHVDLIVANLPYVSRAELPGQGPLCFEPRLALDGGADGIEKISGLCRQAGTKLGPAGCLLLEVGQGQGKAVATILKEIFPTAEIEITPDFSGIERMVGLCLTPGRF